jgi:ribose 5-phosphate isomerase B
MCASSRRRILIASDHAGVELKSAIQTAFPEHHWEDLGPLNGEKVDYPDYAEKLAVEISNGGAHEGILICGSGIGMSIAANKFPGVRAAVVENPVSARLSKEHNDANVLCLGSRFIAPAYGVEIAKAWLETPFSEDHRHSQRLNKIRKIEARFTPKK